MATDLPEIHRFVRHKLVQPCIMTGHTKHAYIAAIVPKTIDGTTQHPWLVRILIYEVIEPLLKLLKVRIFRINVEIKVTLQREVGMDVLIYEPWEYSPTAKIVNARFL